MTTSSFVDFKELKTQINIEQVLTMLGIELRSKGSQLRGCCPIHQGDDDRQFVVTPEKGLFYCFGGCGGGDIITLVAKIENCSPKEAAQKIAEFHGAETGNSTSSRQPTAPSGTVPKRRERDKETKTRSFQPLSYLQATHEAVQGLGVEPETAELFGAGYAPKGILRGLLALPIHDQNGVLLAYCGRAVKDGQPRLSFPNNFDNWGLIFNAHNITKGELYLVRDPLDVLLAYQNGIANVVSFISDISALQLEMLASLMDDRQCDQVLLM